MKKIQLLCIILLGSIGSWAQSPEIDHNSVHGNVQQVKLTKFHIGKPIEDSYVSLPYIIVYNGKGKAESGSYETNNSQQVKKKEFRETYFYDTLGLLAKIHTNLGSDRGEQTRSYIYKDGQIVQVITVNDKKEETRQVFQNTASGQPELEIEYKNGKVTGKNQYTYDATGNKLEQTSYKADGTIAGKMRYEYDKRNNLTELRLYDAKEKLTSTIKCTYEYDKQNNWTKRMVYVNDKPEQETTREITYR